MVVDKAKVEHEAKLLLDKFAKALEKVEKEKAEDSFVDREEFERSEVSSEFNNSEASRFADKSVNNSNNDFKNRMLKNSPNHDDDFIIGETGSWK